MTAWSENLTESGECVCGAQVPRLLTAREVSRRLGVPTSTVYGLAREGRIGGVVRVGRSVRFEPEALERWIDGGGQALPGGWRMEPTL